jgi:hypothetical protein
VRRLFSLNAALARLRCTFPLIRFPRFLAESRQLEARFDQTAHLAK